jgi:glyoxylate carboligase
VLYVVRDRCLRKLTANSNLKVRKSYRSRSRRAAEYPSREFSHVRFLCGGGGNCDAGNGFECGIVPQDRFACWITLHGRAVDLLPQLYLDPIHTRVSVLQSFHPSLTSRGRLLSLAVLGARAHAELIELAEKLKVPIVHALRGKEFIEYDNPFDVGMTGLLGFSSGYRAMMDCDTPLMLGTDFPYKQFYPEKATIIQVDIRGEQIGRRTKVDVAVIGNVKTTLRALLPNLTEKTDDQHVSASIQHYQKTRKELDDLAVGETGQKSIHPQYVAKVIQRTRGEGRDLYLRRWHTHHLGGALPCNEWKTPVWGRFSHGSMASALPQAIGAQLVHTDRQVITLSVDAGPAMLMGVPVVASAARRTRSGKAGGGSRWTNNQRPFRHHKYHRRTKSE